MSHRPGDIPVSFHFDDHDHDHDGGFQAPGDVRADESAISPSHPLPGEDVPAQARLAAVKAARNPLLELSQPLLRALADMPADLSGDDIPAFQALLEREIARFQSLGSSAQIRHEHVVAASYALCTALDEAANSTAWGGGREVDAGLWATRSLASRFHGDTKGGDKVFLLIGRLVANPEEHADLLEVLHRILGLGFEGRFGVAAQGRRQLEAIRHRLQMLLTVARGDVARELSPRWRGVAAGRLPILRRVPVWLTALLLSMGLAGLFGWYRHQLDRTGTELARRIEAIGALRPPLEAPAAALRRPHLRELLAAEMASGLVRVEEDDRRSAVTFRGDEMFPPGQARLNRRVGPMLAKVAEEIGRVAGAVQVIGHSDNRPIGTREFPDNQVLSERRASAVAATLQAAGVAPSRIRVQGHGDAAPVADNATAEGRARNRRVDIVVSRDGGNAASMASTTPSPSASPLSVAP